MPAHFTEKPNSVPVALRLVVDYTRLNKCFIRDQQQVFPAGKEIRQHLGSERKVLVTPDALATYYQIDVDNQEQHKTTFLVNRGRFFFKKTVMGNQLSSNSWLRASDKVINGLKRFYKLVDDLLIGGRDYDQLAERLGKLLARCRQTGMTLASYKVQVGEGTVPRLHHGRTKTICRPKESEGHNKIPKTNLTERAKVCMGYCNQLNHYVPGITWGQVLLKMFLKNICNISKPSLVVIQVGSSALNPAWKNI